MKFQIARSLLVAAATMIALSSPAFAITAEQRQIINYGASYYDPSGNSCGNYGVIGGGKQSGVWDSGEQPPYILQRFMIEVLKDVAAKTGKPVASTLTKEHLLALVTFARGEGGDINNTSSVFNPLNTGAAPDLVAGAAHGNGTQSFKSFDAGVEGTARALTDDNHTRLAAALTNQASSAEDFMYALTYFQKYPGNAIWAEASDPAYHNQGTAGQDAYYHRYVGLVEQTRTQYTNFAALVIGTPAKEQLENLTDIAKLDNSLLPNGSGTTKPTPTNDISGSGGCGQAATGGQ